MKVKHLPFDSFCKICGNSGVTVKCFTKECYEQFHVECALRSKFYTEELSKQICCPNHTKLKLEQRLIEDYKDQIKLLQNFDRWVVKYIQPKPKPEIP